MRQKKIPGQDEPGCGTLSPVKCAHCPIEVLPGNEMAEHLAASHPDILEQLMRESMQQLDMFFG